MERAERKRVYLRMNVVSTQFEPCECGESREKESLSKNECGQHTNLLPFCF